VISREHEGVKWLEFEIFQEFKELAHGVFLRKGGLDLGKQADAAIMQRQRDKVKRCLRLEALVFGKHQHADVIIEFPWEGVEVSCDGIFTEVLQQGLMVAHADCQAVLFYDPYKKVIANIHCGWRGNVANILGKAVRVLNRQKGCRPQDLLVGISPSLGPEKAEFINYKEEFPKAFKAYEVKPCFFNLWAISRDQLLQEGVLLQHIEIASLCTHTGGDDFFSYRRDRDTKRNATVIALQK